MLLTFKAPSWNEVSRESLFLRFKASFLKQVSQICFVSVDTHRRIAKQIFENRSPRVGSDAWRPYGSGRATVSSIDYRATGIKNLSAKVQQLVTKHAHARESKSFRDGQWKHIAKPIFKTCQPGLEVVRGGHTEVVARPSVLNLLTIAQPELKTCQPRCNS